MSDARDGRRQALLDELRRLHRAEPAPAALRQRLLEQAERGAVLSARSRGWEAARRALRPALARSTSMLRLDALALAGVGGALVLAVALRSTEPGSLALGPEPMSSSPRARAAAPRPGDPPGEAGDESAELAASMARGTQPCPLAQVPRGAVLMPQKGGAPGLTLHTFEQQTFSCGPLTRRYLEHLPPRLEARSRGPVLLVLHDAGESAEAMHAQRARLDFGRVAEEKNAIIIYANAAPGFATDVAVPNSGAWQTDSRTHLEVDDVEYLGGILADLEVRHVIDGKNDVYLAGYGDGATMALDAAVRSSGYVGVAAFQPPNLPLTSPDLRRGSRLSRVLLVYRMPPRASAGEWRSSLSIVARRWGAALGLEPRFSFGSWSLGDPKQPAGTVDQFDVSLPATGSSAVRVYLLDGAVEPPPGALHAWDFLTGADGPAPEGPRVPELAVDPMFADRESVQPGDADGFEYPSMVLPEDTVRERPSSPVPKP